MKGRTDELKKGDVKNSDVFSNKLLFILEDSIFETMSKRAWTDVLLQVYKVNCKYIYYLSSEELMAKKLCFEQDMWYIQVFFPNSSLKLNTFKYLFLSNREEK